MATLADQVRDMIQTQKQELKRLNDKVQLLTQSYNAEREMRGALAKKCKELEDIIKNQGMSSNYPPPITSASSQDSEHTIRELAYRQYRESSINQQDQYNKPPHYHPATHHELPSHYTNQQRPAPSQQPNSTVIYPNSYSTQANNPNNPKFVGGFTWDAN